MAIIRGRQMGLDMPSLAMQFKTSKSVIWATLKTSSRSKATARTSKTTTGDDKIIVRMSKKNPRLTSTDINSELKDQNGFHVSFLNIILIYKIPFGFVTEDLCVSVSKAHDGVELSRMNALGE
uniref:Uncharacterized protein n=1 Tax=Caenorhabditis japonica TaxID=281687 RepID=A0A8R1IXL9_CAEJA